MISARFLSYEINRRVNQKMVEYNIENLYDKIHYLTNQGYYGKYILEYYSQVEIEELSD